MFLIDDENIIHSVDCVDLWMQLIYSQMSTHPSFCCLCRKVSGSRDLATFIIPNETNNFNKNICSNGKHETVNQDENATYINTMHQQQRSFYLLVFRISLHSVCIGAFDGWIILRRFAIVYECVVYGSTRVRLQLMR